MSLIDDLDTMIREAEEKARAADRHVALLEQKVAQAEMNRQQSESHVIKVATELAQGQDLEETNKKAWTRTVASLRQKMEHLRGGGP